MANRRKLNRYRQGGGFAFQAAPPTSNIPAKEKKPKGRPRKTPEYRDPETVPLKPYRPKRVRPQATEPALVTAPEPEASPVCTAVPALPSYYPAAAHQADLRLQAGHRQGLCLTCKRWRWADEPCEAARFRPGRKPRWRLPSG